MCTIAAVEASCLYFPGAPKVTAHFGDYVFQATNGVFSGNASAVGFVDYRKNSLVRLVELNQYENLRYENPDLHLSLALG